MAELISYFAAAIVSFLGLFIGWALGKIAPEELKQGKKYFLLMQRLILLIILGTILYFYNVYVIIIIAALWLLSNLMFKYKVQTPYFYLGLGVVFWLASTLHQNWFLLESALILLYGTFTGTLLVYEKKELKYYLFHLAFFVCLLLYFIQ